MVALDSVSAEGFVEGVRRAGRTVRSIEPLLGDGARLSLLPRAEAARRSDYERRVTLWFVMVALAAWGLVGGWSFGRGIAEERQAREDLAASRPLLDTLAVVHRSMDSAASMIQALAAAEQARSDVARQLLALAAALPDSTYLLSVDLDAQHHGRVTGRSPRPMTALAAAQRIPGLAVDLEQPPVREGTLDRFAWRLGGELTP
jgi:hypothetical protein